MTKIIKPIHTRHVRASGRCVRIDHRSVPLPASIISPTMIGQPIMTAILAVPLLGEIPTILQFSGGRLPWQEFIWSTWHITGQNRFQTSYKKACNQGTDFIYLLRITI